MTTVESRSANTRGQSKFIWEFVLTGVIEYKKGFGGDRNNVRINRLRTSLLYIYIVRCNADRKQFIAFSNIIAGIF